MYMASQVMMNEEAEILLHNGFPNHGGEGDLLVGIVSKGQIEKDAVLIIDQREVMMSNVCPLRCRT